MAETHTVASRKRIRKVFGKGIEVAVMPNLIEVQKESYDQFLQVKEPTGGRINEGLQAVFKSVFPISDFRPGRADRAHDSRRQVDGTSASSAA